MDRTNEGPPTPSVPAFAPILSTTTPLANPAFSAVAVGAIGCARDSRPARTGKATRKREVALLAAQTHSRSASAPACPVSAGVSLKSADPAPAVSERLLGSKPYFHDTAKLGTRPVCIPREQPAP